MKPFGSVGAAGAPAPATASAPSATPAASAAVNSDLEDAIKDIASNSTEVRRTCLQTLLKITENVEKNPTEAKFRRIKMENAVFVKKVAACTGGTEALLAAGWQPTTHEDVD